MVSDGILDELRGQIHPRLRCSIIGDFCSEGGAHERGIRDNPHSTNVESIRIPAGSNGGIIVMMTFGMHLAGKLEELEVFVGNVEQLSPELAGELGTSGSVPWIRAFVDSPAVVKQREESNNVYERTGSRSKNTGIPLDPEPVIWPV